MKKILSIVLALTLLVGIMPTFAMGTTISSDVICLSSLEPITYDRYTGNLGDSCFFNLDRNGLPGIDNKYYRYGNIGVDGTIYENGFEVWIARWNFENETSWASITYDIGGSYTTLSGKTGLIRSYNITSFNTTLYFYGDDELLYSQVLTASNYEFNFSVDVSGVNTLKVMLKDNSGAKGGTSFAIYDLFLSGDKSDDNIDISKKAKYTQQHLEFANSETFNTVSNDFRYSKILWENYHGSTSQTIAEFVYDIQEGFFETISFQDIASLENPYDAIILDLISSKCVEDSFSDILKSSELNIIDSIANSLIKTFQADEDWAKGDIVGNFKELLDTNPSDYSSNKLYQSLDKFLEGQGTEKINELFSEYDCFHSILSEIDAGAKGVDYFLEILKYVSTIESYYNASTEIKAVLKEVADIIPSVNATYGKKFVETYNNYSSCIDYDSITQNVLNYAMEKGFWLISDFMSDVLQDSVLTFCKTALKMTESAASTLVASLWAAKTGFNLGNMITENDTLVNCRRLLRANYMLDEAVHYVMSSHASTLKANPSYAEALYFDAAFNLFKNLQISSLNLHQKYMQSNGTSFINFLIGKQDFFRTEAEAQAVIINTWKTIKCHDENLINSIMYSKINTSDTFVVACPTNVYVYDKTDNSLVAFVTNNAIHNINNNLTIAVESDVKAICLPDLNKYEIKIEATDSGEMTVLYSVNSLGRTHYERAVLFENIQLNDKSTFEICVKNNDEVTLKNENNETILPNLDTANLVFQNIEIDLQDDLTINCKVKKTLFTECGYSNPYVVLDFEDRKISVKEYIEFEDYYIFNLNDIALKYINDTIYATLYATYNDVEYASEEYSTSIKIPITDSQLSADLTPINDPDLVEGNKFINGFYVQGAQIRIPSEDGKITLGLRFINVIDNNLVIALKNNNEVTDISYGTVIISANKYTGGMIDLGYKGVTNVSGEKIFKNSSNFEEQYFKYTACVINTPEEQFKTKLVMRPYLTFIYEGNEITLYGEQYSTASLYTVAEVAVSPESIETEEYKAWINENIIKSLSKGDNDMELEF